MQLIYPQSTEEFKRTCSEKPVYSRLLLSEFCNVGFSGEGKTGLPGEKPLGAEQRSNNKLNPQIMPDLGIKPVTHWWGASPLTRRPCPPTFSS